MKYLPSFLSVVCFLFFLPKGYSNQTIQQLDSLKNVLKTADDTTYVNTAVKVCLLYFRHQKLDSMEMFAQKAVKKAEASNYPKQIYAAYDIYASAKQGKQEYGESVVYYKKAIAGWKSIKDKKGLSKTYNNIGRLYHMINAYEKAYEYYLESLKLAQQIGNEYDIHICYQNLGFVLTTLERYDDALEYKQKVVNYAQRKGELYMEAVAYIGMGSIMRDLEKYDSAHIYYQKTNDLAHQLGNIRMQVSALQFLAYNAIKWERFEQAFPYLNAAAPLIGPEEITVLSYQHNYMAEALFGLKKHSEALEYANKAMDYAKMDSTLVLLNNANYQLYQFHKELGNSDEALTYHEVYKDLQDSILNEEKISQIQNLEIQYETEQKESQIASLQQEGQIQKLRLRQRTLLLSFLVLGFLLATGLIYFIYRQKLLQEAFSRMQTEQRLLRTQMNPHFFFHALSSIQEYLLNESDKRKSVSYLSKFSKLMRNVLDSSRTESISLEEEIQTLENYISLQQLRYDQAFQYDIQVDKSLQEEVFNVPPLLLQPVVENAIEHGLVPKGRDGHLQLIFSKEAHQLKITVEDDGVGRDLSPNKSNRKSVALSLVKDRLAFLSKRQKEEVQMEVIDLKDESGLPLGTQVIFYFPLDMAI
jgi:tetratricopeptide (TPR) repeat protein